METGDTSSCLGGSRHWLETDFLLGSVIHTISVSKFDRPKCKGETCKQDPEYSPKLLPVFANACIV